jgi:hypothetical protein
MAGSYSGLGGRAERGGRGVRAMKVGNVQVVAGGGRERLLRSATPRVRQANAPG